MSNTTPIDYIPFPQLGEKAHLPTPNPDPTGYVEVRLIKGDKGDKGDRGDAIGLYEVISTFPHTLTAYPQAASQTQLFINGQKQNFGSDYTIDGLLVKWKGFPIKAHWSIEIFY